MHKSARRTPSSSAKERAARWPTSADATLSRRDLLPTRLARRADLRPLCLALLLLCSDALATTADEFFAEGRRAFEQGDYEQALSGFQSAARAGLPGPAVHFNIGVAAYRLGRYAEAEAAFRATARTPEMAALAHYNLGLTALRRGDERAAADWFSLALAGAADERLRSLAATQLSALPAPVERNWTAYATVGGGYDDNVALVSDAEVIGVSGLDDTFTEAQAAFAAPLGAPWRFDAGALLLDYHDLDAFDQATGFGGARYRWDVGPWRHEAHLGVGYSTLDGERFESSRSAAAQTSVALPSDWRAQLRYRFSDVDGGDAFAGLSGQRHEARAEARRTWRPWELVCDYTYEQRDVGDASVAGSTHETGIELNRAAVGDWSLGAGARLRASWYAGGDEEQQVQLSFRVARRLSARWRLVAGYSYTNSDANVNEFDYTRHRVSAALDAQL